MSIAKAAQVAYVDLDSCYYNLAGVIFGIKPWTVVINRFNHIISVPHWLEGHFGVKKIDYLASPTRVKLKVGRLVETFSIDALPDGRNIMTEFIAGILEDVKAFAPNAVVAHKDSIVAKAEYLDIDVIRRVVGVPCTIGIGDSKEEAKDDCRAKKAKKKRKYVNMAILVMYLAPMILSYLVNILTRRIK